MLWLTTQNVDSEAWRRILEFANEDWAMDCIIKRHGEPLDESTRSNYRKQASQIRVCILQGNEYFAAARSASIITSPNHLYYGMVSLCSAIMLLNGTGECSLDWLRRNRKNRNHGLDFSTDASAKTCAKGLSILEATRVTVSSRGHFLNWYSTLRRDCLVYATVTRIQGNRRNINKEAVGSEIISTPVEIVDKTFNLVQLIRVLPDMMFDARRYGVAMACSRVNYEIFYFLDGGHHEHRWRIHGAGTRIFLEKILAYFAGPPNIAHLWKISDAEQSDTCIVSINHPHSNPPVHFKFPTIRETLNNDQIAYATDAIGTPELADAYMLCFALSMLSRYYPDLWIKCIESRCRGAQLIDYVLYVLLQKFPVLALSALLGEDVIISTHRAPWYD